MTWTKWQNINWRIILDNTREAWSSILVNKVPDGDDDEVIL